MRKIIRLTESDLHNIVKEAVNRILKKDGEIDNYRTNDSEDRRNRMMQKYSRFNDGSNNPYGDEGRYYRHLETEPQGIGESMHNLREEGGDGATNCVGINVGGAAGQAKNHIDAAPFSNKPLKQKHNLGNPTTKKANMVDITPALDRTPGFSMGERVGDKKKK